MSEKHEHDGHEHRHEHHQGHGCNHNHDEEHSHSHDDKHEHDHHPDDHDHHHDQEKNHDHEDEHGHGNCHHSVAPKGLNKVFMIAIAANLIYTIIQAIFALHANSMSLLADAGHNLGDVLSLLLAWAANWLLTQPSTDNFSYGFKRTSILASTANSIILLVACVLIIYGAIDKLITPQPVHAVTVMVVAAIGIFINLGSALLFIRESKEDINIRGAFLHLASDALVSVGVVIAAIVIYFTHWFWLDPVISLVIVATIVYSTWHLFSRAIHLLLDAVPKTVDRNDVKAYFEKITGVKSIHDLHIWGLSTRDTALTAHLIMPELRLSDEQHAKIRKDMLKKFKIGHVTVQVEQSEGCYQCD